MKLSATWAVSACLALAAAGPAATQDAAPEDGVLVSELLVRPLTPGPAWWRVSDADSSVYVLAIPEITPRGMTWDQSVLDRRLDGAKVLLTPMEFSALKSAPGLAVAAVRAPFAMLRRPKASPPETKPLESRLPPAVAARFKAAREALGQPADRYAALSFVRAADLIASDFRARQPIGTGEVWKQVEAAAQRHKVKTEPAYRFALPAGRLDVDMTAEAGGPECVDHALTAMVERARLEREAAQAWAEGDVRGLLKPTLKEQLPHCTLANTSFGVTPGTPAAKRMDEDFRRQQVTAIERALRTPGRSIAVLSVFSPFGDNPADSLLGQSGVLQQLRAKGFTVTSPAGLEN
jgi:hypothetical protein